MNSVNNLFKLYFKGHNGRPDGWGLLFKTVGLFELCTTLFPFTRNKCPMQRKATGKYSIKGGMA